MRNIYSLTPSELRVLELVVMGYSTKKIASVTGNSPNTIQNHLKAIYKKLGVKSKLEAVILLIASMP